MYVDRAAKAEANLIYAGNQVGSTPASASANANVVEPPPKPYSVFTRREKWFIVAVTGFAASFR